MKKILLFTSTMMMLLAVSAVSCKSSKNNTNSESNSKNTNAVKDDSIQSLRIDPNFDQNAKNDPCTIESVTLKQDILEITVSYSGGCQQHNFDLVFNGMYKKSLPVKATIFLVHENKGDNCRSIVTQKLAFNIRSIRNPAGKSGEVHITLDGWANMIPYSYQ